MEEEESDPWAIVEQVDSVDLFDNGALDTAKPLQVSVDSIITRA